MSQQDPELEAFAKFIGAIEPWVGEVVLIGGWAHRLYRLHPLARKLECLPLTTIDGDVAVPPKLKAQELTVRERLLAAGFKVEFVGEDRPPATHYHYGKNGGFYAEFLTSLVGSEYDRSGKRKATTEVSGISSQLLRYIEMLMISPWKVELGKDYIHDTIEVFSESLEELQKIFEHEIAPKLHPRRRAELESAADRLFGKVEDSIREAAVMAVGRKLAAERLAETSQAGLKEIFTRE